MKGRRFSGGGWMGTAIGGRAERSHRRRVVDLGRGLGAEPLEVRALLSGQTVQLIKDVNAVETYPADLTPAGSNLFYKVEDSTDTGVDLMVTNAGGTQVLLDTGSSLDSFSSLTDFTAAGSNLFFLANGPDSGQPTSSGPATVPWRGRSRCPPCRHRSRQGSMRRQGPDGGLGSTLVFETHDVRRPTAG